MITATFKSITELITPIIKWFKSPECSTAPSNHCCSPNFWEAQERFTATPHYLNPDVEDDGLEEEASPVSPTYSCPSPPDYPDTSPVRPSSELEHLSNELDYLDIITPNTPAFELSTMTNLGNFIQKPPRLNLDLLQ